MNHMEWKPIETAPECKLYPGEHLVDLWIRANHSGAERRAPDCYLWEGKWFQKSLLSLEEGGMTPLFWIELPSPPKTGKEPNP